MEKITRWFSIPGGSSRMQIESVDSAGGQAVRLQIATEFLKAGSNKPVLTQNETAIVSDRGLESFVIEETAEGLSTRTQGTRESKSMAVSISGEGAQGKLSFGVDSFDISTYELLLLEISDLAELSREPFRLFDPEDLDIYIGRITSRGHRVKTATRQVRLRNITLHVDGAEYQFVMTHEGELISVRGVDVSAVLATEAQIKKRRLALTGKAA